MKMSGLEIKPRYAVATVAILMVGFLMYTQSIDENMGVMLLVGILGAVGAYESVSTPKTGE